MPLTLDQYVRSLDARDIPWPAPPAAEPVRAKPHLPKMPEVRAVLWTAYGTLLSVHGGELVFVHPEELVNEVALGKTVEEFKMWGAMTRKPGQPAAYLKELYVRAYDEVRMQPSADKSPEVPAEKVWEGVVKKLLQKEYKWDAGTYGAVGEYAKKIAYFYHASLQGAGCYDGAAAAVETLASLGTVQGLCADGQCFTAAQLAKGLRDQDGSADLDRLIPAPLRVISSDQKVRKPSEKLFRAALSALQNRGISAGRVLHVGSSLNRDVVPARKLGMKTALFAGDRNSLSADAADLKDPQKRPDALLTELPQITEMLG